MWLTRQLTEAGGKGAKVTSGETAGGAQFALRGESDYQSPETLFPYGFSSFAKQGSKAVLVDGICAGVSALPDGSLQEGEVRLYSSGGAEILLKSNGQVVINGQIFEAK